MLFKCVSFLICVMIQVDIRRKLIKELLANHVKEVSEINELVKEFNDWLKDYIMGSLTREEKEFIKKYPSLVIKQENTDIRQFLTSSSVSNFKGGLHYWENLKPLNLELTFGDIPGLKCEVNEIKYPDEIKKKLEKVYELIWEFRRKSKSIRNIIESSEINITDLKTNSPKIYEIYEKIK